MTKEEDKAYLEACQRLMKSMAEKDDLYWSKEYQNDQWKIEKIKRKWKEKRDEYMITRIIVFEGVTPRKDKSVTIRLSTLEQTPSQVAELFDLMNKVCVVAIKPDSESYLKDELDALDEIEVDLLDNHKTPSKRLRNTLYVLQEQALGRKPSGDEFKEFYKTKLETIINHYKDKLV